MAVMFRTKESLLMIGTLLNEALSFAIFCLLDMLDFFLSLVFKLVDFVLESEWSSCCYGFLEKYLNTHPGGKIFVPEKEDVSKVVSLRYANLHSEEISDTLFTRPSLVSEVVSKFCNDHHHGFERYVFKGTIVKSSCDKGKNGVVRSTLSVDSTIVERRLQGKIGGGHNFSRVPRWSDCHCLSCHSSPSVSSQESLFVRVQEPQDKNAQEDVLFIHGFVSSSLFWTETVFPNFSTDAKSTYRFIAFDLLGFGKSPKPRDSIYTLREHLDMIEKSVLVPYNVKSFHIVAHSLGCILAIALAVKHPGLVKSLTLLAPPYIPVPKGEQAPTQYVMRKVAPRKVWPLITFSASIACWYEHITRMGCLVVSKHHRFWQFFIKLVTINRAEQYLLEGFFCHTHNAAWHTLHNILCGTGGKLDGYMDIVRDQLTCAVNIIHGQKDDLVPLECSYNVKSKIPRATIKLIENKDHITIVIGRQKAFTEELEDIWARSSS